MDYRHTEDFARRMEAAHLQACGLRREAVDRFWSDVGRLFVRAARALRAALARLGHSGRTLAARRVAAAETKTPVP
jgi:hypothetical protein